jgi:hypothetical protein
LEIINQKIDTHSTDEIFRYYTQNSCNPLFIYEFNLDEISQLKNLILTDKINKDDFLNLIKAKYRLISSHIHPDKNKNKDQLLEKENFQKLVNARDLLNQLTSSGPNKLSENLVILALINLAYKIGY